jgi:hypothetical protein
MLFYYFDRFEHLIQAGLTTFEDLRMPIQYYVDMMAEDKAVFVSYIRYCKYQNIWQFLDRFPEWAQKQLPAEKNPVGQLETPLRTEGRMDEESQFMQVFIDLLPNQPKNEQTRENIRQSMLRQFEQRLPDAVERVWELAPVILRQQGEYLALLLEARELYLLGHFYSCVAMCGIVGERLVKDALRVSILIRSRDSSGLPPDTAFDQLERVEVNGIVRFLRESNLLSSEAAKAAEDLGQLRNQYAHARGKRPQPDALKAIKLLHILVEDTVSAFKEFDIKDGAFVRKSTS